MLRLAIDENFNHNVLRGLLRVAPDLDLIRVQDASLAGASDPAVLEWAAAEGRVLVTHDISTLTAHAHERVRRGERMPGLIQVPRAVLIRQANEDLQLLAECGDPVEL